MKKYSLHIGINQVDPGHYGAALEDLASCHNDAKAMYSLAKHLNFKESLLLLDAEACAEPVKLALNNYANRLERGDLLLITYSGHGGCIPNLNEDTEDEEYGDQTWCLYDRQLIDDELGHIWPRFKAGVHILVFLDACHSGTAVRDHKHNADAMAIEKELEAFFEQEGAITKSLPGYVENPLYLKFQALYDPIIEAHTTEPQPLKASLQLFAACQDDQQARAGRTYSYFTLAFIQVMMRVWKRIHNYQDLFDMLKQQSLPTQVPNEMKLGPLDNFFIKNPPFMVPGEQYPKDLGQLFRRLKNVDFP